MRAWLSILKCPAVDMALTETILHELLPRPPQGLIAPPCRRARREAHSIDCRILLVSSHSHSDQFLPRDDYAECWAWVHFLLESSPETKLLLREYLYRLHVDGSTVPLSSRMAWRFGLTAEQLADRMAEHILKVSQNAVLAESEGDESADKLAQASE